MFPTTFIKYIVGRMILDPVRRCSLAMDALCVSIRRNLKGPTWGEEFKIESQLIVVKGEIVAIDTCWTGVIRHTEHM